MKPPASNPVACQSGGAVLLTLTMGESMRRIAEIMSFRAVIRLLVALGTVFALTAPVGAALLATSGTASATAPCTWSVSGGGTLVSQTLITGAVAGSTEVTATCPTFTDGSYLAVAGSSLAAIVSPPTTDNEESLVGVGTLDFLNGSGVGTVDLPADGIGTSDPNGVCPPSTAQINAGLVGCTVSVANLDGSHYGTITVAYASEPSPASPPTLVLTPSHAAPGQSVSVSETAGHVSDWWGNYAANQPIGASDITVGGHPAGASSVQVAPAVYPSNGTTGVLSPPSLSGSFTVPCSAASGPQSVAVTEPNTTGIPGTITGTATLTVASGAGGCLSSISPNHGPTSGGTQVTISGVGFTGTSAVHFGTVPATSFHVNSNTSVTAVSPAGHGIVAVNLTTPVGTTSTIPNVSNSFQYGFAGYNLVGADGGIFNYGDASFHGSMGGKPLDAKMVGSATTPDGGGYWMVGADGGIFAFGDAHYYGSMGGKTLNAPMVGMAATGNGGGYWLVAADGGIFNFGDALFHGSAGSLLLNKPIVGMASVNTGGYVLVASDGGVFPYGDIGFFGSMGGQALNAPVVGIMAVDTGGYWLVAADGGIFAFGDAPYHGSMGGSPLNAPITSGTPA